MKSSRGFCLPGGDCWKSRHPFTGPMNIILCALTHLGLWMWKDRVDKSCERRIHGWWHWAQLASTSWYHKSPEPNTTMNYITEQKQNKIMVYNNCFQIVWNFLPCSNLYIHYIISYWKKIVIFFTVILNSVKVLRLEERNKRGRIKISEKNCFFQG